MDEKENSLYQAVQYDRRQENSETMSMCFMNPLRSPPMKTKSSPVAAASTGLTSASSGKAWSSLIGMIQIYYYNNYPGTVRSLSVQDLHEHHEAFLSEYKEFRRPSDNDKVLLCFKRFDVSNELFPESSVFIVFDSKEQLKQVCHDYKIPIIVNKSQSKSSSHFEWISFRDVMAHEDCLDMSFGSNERIVLEVGSHSLFHVPSKKVAKQIRNRLGNDMDIAVRAPVLITKIIPNVDQVNSSPISFASDNFSETTAEDVDSK